MSPSMKHGHLKEMKKRDSQTMHLLFSNASHEFGTKNTDIISRSGTKNRLDTRLAFGNT